MKVDETRVNIIQKVDFNTAAEILFQETGTVQIDKTLHT
jgi:hypothetical protein